MSEALVLVSNPGAVRVLTLNRPGQLNAFTAELHAALLPALDAAAADASVRAVVITGAGRGFCAGQDLNDAGMAADADGQRDVGTVILKHYQPLALRIRSMPVPVIAAVNGVAAGAGASIAMACDIVIAARSASFVQAFAKIGLIPDAGGTWLLPRLVGRQNAIALAMTGDKLSADDAKAMGIVWQVYDDALFMDSAMALAARLAAMPVKALAETRRAIDLAIGMDYADAIGMEADLQRQLGRAHDFAEGVAAFLAKRAPVFKDR